MGRLVKQSTTYLIALLVLGSQWVYAQQPRQYFEISPNRCLSKDDQCRLTTNLSWHVNDHFQVCLKIYERQVRIFCDLPASMEKYSLELLSHEDIRIDITNREQTKLLATQRIEILHVNERNPRRRIAWSIF
ncbi:DUF3019 domain-containing protein [Thalassotalea mangrovi]|nr:DUF3019 domain-containing protein [Thalassotalea mangrovi]